MNDRRPESPRRRAWRVIRTLWVTAGVLLMVYLPLSFCARGVDEGVMKSGGGVEVVEDDDSIAFMPAGGEGNAGLLFIPGGLVEPRAYAPLLRSIAQRGHPAILVKLPDLAGRHAMGEDGRRRATNRAIAALAR